MRGKIEQEKNHYKDKLWKFNKNANIFSERFVSFFLCKKYLIEILDNQLSKELKNACDSSYENIHCYSWIMTNLIMCLKSASELP